MEMNFKEKMKDERPYWKVAVSLAISQIVTVLFINYGYKLLGFFRLDDRFHSESGGELA